MKRSFYITAVCGSALAIANPTAALGQNTQTNHNQSATQQAKQAVQHRQSTDAQSTDPTSILRKLEGVWDVEVRVNEALWNQKAMDRDTANPDWNQNERDRANQERSTRDSDDSDMQQSMGTKVMRGVAETSLIMDGRILREKTYLNRTMSAGASEPAPNQPGNQRPATGDFDPRTAMQTLSFISFDEGPGTYSAVFLSSKDGVIHLDTGAFDSSSNRITFEGRRDNGARHNIHTYRAPNGPNAVDQLDDEFIDRSYPGESTDRNRTNQDRQKSTDADRKSTDADRRDDIQSSRNSRDRDGVNRNEPTPIDPDRDQNQPERTTPAQDNDRKDYEGPFWEHHNNTDDGREANDTNRSTRSKTARGQHEDGDAFVVVPAQHNQGTVRVVLEMLGSDQYRVTMYEGPSLGWSDRDANSANPTMKDRNDARSERNQESKNTSNALASNVVYQATFTRAKTNEAAYRKIFADAND